MWFVPKVQDGAQAGKGEEGKQVEWGRGGEDRPTRRLAPRWGCTKRAASTLTTQHLSVSVPDLFIQTLHTSLLGKATNGKFPNTCKTPSIRTQNKPEVFTDLNLL